MFRADGAQERAREKNKPQGAWRLHLPVARRGCASTAPAASARRTSTPVCTPAVASSAAAHPGQASGLDRERACGEPDHDVRQEEEEDGEGGQYVEVLHLVKRRRCRRWCGRRRRSGELFRDSPWLISDRARAPSPFLLLFLRAAAARVAELVGTTISQRGVDGLVDGLLGGGRRADQNPSWVVLTRTVVGQRCGRSMMVPAAVAGVGMSGLAAVAAVAVVVVTVVSL